MASSSEASDHVDDQPEPSWSVLLTRRIASQVRYWREQRGLTAQQLADRVDQLGYRMPRSILANLENNRRENITVAELLILAAALDVPPVLLIAPVGRESTLEVLPRTPATPWRARGWIHGAIELRYQGSSAPLWQQSRRAITLYDVHRLLVREHQQIALRIKRLADQEHLDVGDMAPDDLRLSRGPLADFVDELAYSLDRLRNHRALIRSEGFELPELPPDLAVALKETTPVGRHHRARDSDASYQLLPPVVYQQLESSRPLPVPENPGEGSRETPF